MNTFETISVAKYARIMRGMPEHEHECAHTCACVVMMCVQISSPISDDVDLFIFPYTNMSFPDDLISTELPQHEEHHYCE